MRSWKHLISPLTKYSVIEAFKILFDCKPSDADITVNGDDLLVVTKTATIIHGGFGYHTERPLLTNKEDIYYTGSGCDWGVDSVGVRYYKLDPETDFPVHWLRAQAAEILFRYLEQCRKGECKLRLK